MATVTDPIPQEQLAELWFGFKQQILDKLQAAFRNSGLKQEHIAARLKRDPATISRCLRGRRDMNMRTFFELARGMNCRLRIEVDQLEEIRAVNRENGRTWVPITSAGTTGGSLIIIKDMGDARVKAA